MDVRLLEHPEYVEIRLDGVPGNVLDLEGCREITRIVRARSGDPSCKAILFTAAGKHFSYGASVPEHRPGLVQEFLPAFHEIFAALIESELPTVAAVRGFCLGGAFELAAFCNVLIADSTAMFGVPEIQLGVFPPVACALFPQRYGGALAEELILTGRRMPAEEAARRGIVTVLADSRDLESECEKFLSEQLLARSGLALRHAVGAFRRDFAESFLTRLRQLERAYLDELMATHDAKEGIEAFLGRREPEWTNA